MSRSLRPRILRLRRPRMLRPRGVGPRTLRAFRPRGRTVRRTVVPVAIAVLAVIAAAVAEPTGSLLRMLLIAALAVAADRLYLMWRRTGRRRARRSRP